MHTHRKGVTAALKVISMRREIIAFATTMFPEADTLTALEMLLLAVSVTLDDVLFAMQDAQDVVEDTSDEDPQPLEIWDYVY